jgi:hypothetical protein
MPNIEKPETIERKFLGKLSKKALSFIKVNIYLSKGAFKFESEIQV